MVGAFLKVGQDRVKTIPPSIPPPAAVAASRRPRRPRRPRRHCQRPYPLLTPSPHRPHCPQSIRLVDVPLAQIRTAIDLDANESVRTPLERIVTKGYHTNLISAERGYFSDFDGERSGVECSVKRVPLMRPFDFVKLLVQLEVRIIHHETS